MFANLKLFVNYSLVFLSIFLLRNCSGFHIHIVPNNQIPNYKNNHNHNIEQNNNLLNNNENAINSDLRPIENIANFLLSNLFLLNF